MSIGRNMAIKANIIIDQGADYSAVIDVKNTNGTVKDLTGFTAAAQMRKNYAQSTPSGTFACTDNNTGGQITITMSNAVTGALEPGRYLYDVEIADGAPNITRVVEGTVTVTPGMTR
tara:strand:- start:169 stop:519 length:351 start_codon:yes stop_codon:yes gene_type:complete